ncbi:MAG: membrane protein insertase YidC, partial [Pseudomonadota bacterium]|nr:membrane protein insertase YidC [Pseudomonadota bacterium]
RDYPATPPVVAQSIGGNAAGSNTLGDSVPQAGPPGAATTTPAEGAPAASSSAAPLGGAAPAPPDTLAPATAAAPMPGPPVHVVTDVFDLDINLKGGELDRADLLQYPVHKDTPNIPVRLLNSDPEDRYLLQTGLAGAPGEAAPSHLVTWSAAEKSYVLPAGADELRVPLTWTDGHGLTVTKTFTFKRASYAIDLAYKVENGSGAARSFAAYSQFLRHWVKASRSYFDVETYSFKGPAVYDGMKTEDLKVDNDTDSKFSQTVTGGWIASLQHHFVSAIVPAPGQPTKIQLQVQGQRYLLVATGPMMSIPAGGEATFDEKLFVGPKLQAQLAAVAPNLERTVDYGKLTVLAHPVFMVLVWVHSVVGNWGWSIIIVTALIKLLFYPLSQASGRSMAKMRAIAPRMKQIQESYKDDREKLGRAMMELYKKEKINPLAGCLPMVVQIPFFISFYWVLLESVEMRQTPFLLWINDLSSRDPYFVLPLLMGSAMYAQFKLNPAPPDPTQAKIMQFMPLVMTGMMAWFPSGLVLYWLTNTVLSIVQQWRVNQVVQAEASKQRS